MLVVGVASCSRIDVESSAEPDWSPVNATTYAWRPDPPGKLADPRIDESHLVKALRAAADRELAARGYRLADSAVADFQVGYWLAVRTREVASPRGGWRNRDDSDGRAGFWESPVNVPPAHIERGTVGLYVVAGEPPRNVWRGVAQGVLRPNASHSERAERVDDAVRRILEEFPRRDTD